MARVRKPDSHRRFEELCALAQTDSLSSEERIEIDAHLKTCGICRSICQEFTAIGKMGMGALAANLPFDETAKQWDERKTRSRIRSVIGKDKPKKS